MLILYYLALASLSTTGSSQGLFGFGSGSGDYIPPSSKDVEDPSPFLRDPTAVKFTVDISAYTTMQDCLDGTNPTTRQIEVPTAGCMNVQPFNLAADEVCGFGDGLTRCLPNGRRLGLERRLQSATPTPISDEEFIMSTFGSMYVTCLGDGSIRREMFDDLNCMYEADAEHYDTYISYNGICEEQVWVDDIISSAGVFYKFEWANDCEVTDLMGTGGKRFCPAWTTSPPTTQPTYPPHPFEADPVPDTFPFTFVFFYNTPDNMQACQDWNIGDPAPFKSFVFEGPTSGCINVVPNKVGVDVDGNPAGNPFYQKKDPEAFSEQLTCLPGGDVLRSDFYDGWDCSQGSGNYFDMSKLGAAMSYVTTTHNTCRRQLGQDDSSILPDKDAMIYKMIWTNGGKCTATAQSGVSSPPTRAPTYPVHPFEQDTTSKVFPFEFTYYQTLAGCQAKDATLRYDTLTWSGDGPADGCVNVVPPNAFYVPTTSYSEYITCQPDENRIRSDFFDDWDCGAGNGNYANTVYTTPDNCRESQIPLAGIGKKAFYRMEWFDGSCKGARKVTPKPKQADPTFKPSPSPPPVVNCPDADIGPAVRLAGMAMMVSFAILALLIWKICWLDNKTFNAEGVEMMRLVMRNEVNYKKPNQVGFSGQSMAGKSEDYSTH